MRPEEDTYGKTVYVKDSTIGDHVYTAKSGGQAKVMRKCHWCKKIIVNFACTECKRKHGWKVDAGGMD